MGKLKESLSHESLEEMIERIQNAIDDRYQQSPYEHLYDWLREANPEVFKQWLSIYDIEKEQ